MSIKVGVGYLGNLSHKITLYELLVTRPFRSVSPPPGAYAAQTTPAASPNAMTIRTRRSRLVGDLVVRPADFSAVGKALFLGVIPNPVVVDLTNAQLSSLGNAQKNRPTARERWSLRV